MQARTKMGFHGAYVATRKVGKHLAVEVGGGGRDSEEFEVGPGLYIVELVEEVSGEEGRVSFISFGVSIESRSC